MARSCFVRASCASASARSANLLRNEMSIVMGSECMRHHHTNGPQTAQAQLPRTEQGSATRVVAAAAER
eukprot:scaffold34010_cov129-Isochrysis_galbana.AAC.1